MADHEVLVLARKLRMDLTAMQAKVTELLTMAARLEPPADSDRTCPECGLHARSLPAGSTLADHRWVSHGVEAIDERAA